MRCLRKRWMLVVCNFEFVIAPIGSGAVPDDRHVIHRTFFKKILDFFGFCSYHRNYPLTPFARLPIHLAGSGQASTTRGQLPPPLTRYTDSNPHPSPTLQL